MYSIIWKYRYFALCFVGGGLFTGVMAFFVQGQAFGFANVPLLALVPAFCVGAVSAVVISALIVRNRNALLERLAAEQEATRQLKEEYEERQRAEETQRQSEEQFRNLARIAPVGIFVTDAEGACIHVNRQWSEISGISEAEARGQGWINAIHPDDRKMVLAEWDFVVRSKGQFLLEYRFLHPDGTCPWVLGQAVASMDAQGAIARYVGTITDMTQHREVEGRLRQTQRMEAVGKLTGGVAHDFNNLLAVIMGNAELLRLNPASRERSTDAIIRAVTRGAELTQRLLAFSRRQPLRPQAMDLGKLVSETSDLLTRTLGESVTVEIDGAPGLWTARVDPNQVEKALLNLALNARDAMPQGGKLTVTMRNVRLDAADVVRYEEMSPGEYVELSVKDTGCGMSAEALAHAFEPFFTTKEVGKGSGLGLSMVYGFAKQSGGHAVIHSVEGEGTTIALFLPRGESVPGESAEAYPAEVPCGRGEEILVIEDSEDVRDLAEKLLTGLDYQVTVVPDAASARRVLADGKVPKLVLSDVVLPGGTSGPDFAREVFKSHPELKIVFMSGYSAEVELCDAVTNSHGVLIRKPFQRRALAAALREALDA